MFNGLIASIHLGIKYLCSYQTVTFYQHDIRVLKYNHCMFNTVCMPDKKESKECNENDNRIGGGIPRGCQRADG